MLSLDEMIAKQLLHPNMDHFADQVIDSATLHLRHDIKSLSNDFGGALVQNHLFNTAAILLLEPLAMSIFRDPMGIKARFETKRKGVDAALALLALSKQQHVPVTIAIGWGKTLSFPENTWIGIEDHQARRMADFGQTNEVSMTKNMAEANTVPEGVGVFEAKRERVLLIGYPFLIMKDYR